MEFFASSIGKHSLDKKLSSLALINKVFAGEQCAARDAVALNAGAGIYVAGLAGSLNAGVQQALTALDSGAAANKLQAFVDATQAVAKS